MQNTIGLARQTSNDPRFERILVTYSHCELRKKLAKKHELKLHIQGRVNQGGCKIDQHADAKRKKISKPPSWNIPEIIQLLSILCFPETCDAFPEQLKMFIEQIHSLISITNIHYYDFNETANNGIFARLVLFKSDNQGESNWKE